MTIRPNEVIRWFDKPYHWLVVGLVALICVLIYTLVDVERSVVYLHDELTAPYVIDHSKVKVLDSIATPDGRKVLVQIGGEKKKGCNFQTFSQWKPRDGGPVLNIEYQGTPIPVGEDDTFIVQLPVPDQVTDFSEWQVRSLAEYLCPKVYYAYTHWLTPPSPPEPPARRRTQE